MHIITELFEIESCRSVLREDFTSNKRKWEIVNSTTECAEIKDGYYCMQNKSCKHWKYYKTKSQLQVNSDFIIETNLQIDPSEEAYGHFGLVWGFDKEREYLNRFTLSADGKRAIIMHFEKDHKKIFHRFQSRKLPSINSSNPVHLAIIKMGAYFHFSINRVNVYTAHESLFANHSPLIGYYVEPGLFVKSNYLEVKKINVRPLEVVTGLQQLMSKN
jgi:hypothetical protein